MTMNFDDINCGGQLRVGTGVVPAIKEMILSLESQYGVV